MVRREDLPEEVSLEELLAVTLEEAWRRRDLTSDKREMALVVTNLEQAALWLCQHRAKAHLGDNALLDWLRQI